MRITSCILSLLFHVSLLFVAFYVPFHDVSHQIDLDRQVYQVELYQFAQKTKDKDSDSIPSDQQISQKTKKSSSPKAQLRPSKISAVKKKSRSSVNSQPPPKKVKIAKKKTQQPPGRMPHKKRSSNQEDVKKYPAKKTPTKKHVVSQALQEIQKSVASQNKGDKDIVTQELASLRRSLQEKSKRRSGGQQGNYRLAEIYGRLVEKQIKDNWRFPLFGTESSLQAVVEVHINAKGGIEDFRMLRTSGRDDFDTSVLRAVEETKSLPPPPREDLHAIQITFNLQERNS
jgi:colicin import membrane protein